MVFATERQHRRVRDYLTRVQESARRQVLIEATVAEVTLNEGSQSGIDWRRIASGAGFRTRYDSLGLDLDNFVGGTNPITGMNRGVIIGLRNANVYSVAMKLLSEYGRVKVLSSPKVSTLNNQPALLRVVDNLVYFEVQSQASQGTTGATSTTITTTPRTVAIGFTMSITPQIDDTGIVTLLVRPTITRLQGFARDPNPQLGNVANMVPIVQTREIDAVVKLSSGEVVMMGGLMEDTEERRREGLPELSALEGVGALFGARRSAVRKTELVIFLRPIVVADPTLSGDYAHVKDLLPNDEFFGQPWQKPINGGQGIWEGVR